MNSFLFNVEADTHPVKQIVPEENLFLTKKASELQ